MWWRDKVIKRIIVETAAEYNVTPDQVLGVLSCVFNTIIKQSTNIRVKFFRIRGIGAFVAKGHTPKSFKKKGKVVKKSVEELDAEATDL